MAAPTSTNNVTSRKLASTITSLWGKIKDTFQTKLTAQTAYSAKGTATKVPQITTNSLGQVTGITEVDINVGGFPMLTSANASGSSKYWKLGTTRQNAQGWGNETFLIYGDGDIGCVPYVWFICIKHRGTTPTIRAQRVGCGTGDNTSSTDLELGSYISNASDNTYTVFIKRPMWYANNVKLLELAHDERFTIDVGYLGDSEPSGAVYDDVEYHYVPSILDGRSKGSTTVPVYIDGNARFQACNTSSMSVGNATTANTLNSVLQASQFEIGSSFGKVGIVNFGSEGKGRLFLEIHVCRYLNGDNTIIFAEFGSDHANVSTKARIMNPDCPYNVYYKSTGNTYEYEVWVCDDSLTGGGTRRGSVIADVSKVAGWTPVTNVSPSTRPSGLTQFTTWHVAMTQNGAGSSRLPVYVDVDGTFNTMNIDEYYCWAQPTLQWTDVMEMTAYNIGNQCNNECLGSVKSINLNATHPSLCYLHVRLPELAGAGRYRFTLEFEITNSNGQTGTSAYGVVILDPPTGYSGESFLAECAYDSSGRPQSSVMNQFHVPPQGSTYRHKLYVDGHTYRVVKTK